MQAVAEISPKRQSNSPTFLLSAVSWQTDKCFLSESVGRVNYFCFTYP